MVIKGTDKSPIGEKPHGRKPHMTPHPLGKKPQRTKAPCRFFFFSMNKGDRIFIGKKFVRKGGYAIQQIFSLSHIEDSIISRENFVRQSGSSIWLAKRKKGLSDICVG